MPIEVYAETITISRFAEPGEDPEYEPSYSPNWFAGGPTIVFEEGLLHPWTVELKVGDYLIDGGKRVRCQLRIEPQYAYELDDEEFEEKFKKEFNERYEGTVDEDDDEYSRAYEEAYSRAYEEAENDLKERFLEDAEMMMPAEFPDETLEKSLPGWWIEGFDFENVRCYLDDKGFCYPGTLVREGGEEGEE